MVEALWRGIPRDWPRIERRELIWLALIVVAALAVRVIWVLAMRVPLPDSLPPMPTGDPWNYNILAQRIAGGEGYVNADGDPTAFWPVGYPAFLALVYLLFGYSHTAVGVAQSVVGAISVAATYALARQFLSGRASLIAAGLTAFIPSHIIGFTPNLLSEVLYTASVLLALIAATRFMRGPTWLNAAAFGFLVGVSVYVKTVLLLFPFAVALLIAIRGGAGMRKAVGLSAVSAAVMLLTLTPWTVRNYFAMDAFVLVSTNGGFNFYIDNAPHSTGGYNHEYNYCVYCQMQHSPSDVMEWDWPGDAEFEDFYYYSEVEQNARGYRLGMEYILNNPVEWLSLIPNKVFHTWARDTESMSYPEGYPELAYWLSILAQRFWILTVLCAVAAALSRPPVGYWLRSPAAVVPLVLVYWVAVHLFAHGEGRYHAPMIPVALIMAAHLFERDADWRAWLPRRWRRA